MESKRFLFSLLIVVFISAATSTAGVGDYNPIKDLTDPYVVEIAKFAVSEYNKNTSTSEKLSFVKVVSGQEQVVAGTHYKLDISTLTVSNKLSGEYEAVVYDKPWAKYRSLISFEEITQKKN